MERDRQERDDAIYDVAFEMLLMANNKRPDDDDTAAFCKTLDDKLTAIPTGQLGMMLKRATTDAAPYPPKVGDLLTAWKRQQVHAPRATFQETEQREIEKGAIPSLDSLAAEAPAQFKTHQRLGLVVVCDCPPWIENKKTVPRPAKLDENGAFWRCGQKENPCGLLVDARKEKLVRKASVESAYGGAPRDESTPEVSSVVKTKGGGRFQLFLEECGIDFEPTEQEKELLAGFSKWCDSQRPPVRVTPSTYPERWNEYQFDVAVAA